MDKNTVLVELANQPKTWIPRNILRDLGVANDPEGRRVMVEFGAWVAEFEKENFVDWTIDPVSGLKVWTLTDVGLEAAEVAKAAADKAA